LYFLTVIQKNPSILAKVSDTSRPPKTILVAQNLNLDEQSRYTITVIYIL